jgi:hypothetical protein
MVVNRRSAAPSLGTVLLGASALACGGLQTSSDAGTQPSGPEAGFILTGDDADADAGPIFSLPLPGPDAAPIPPPDFCDDGGLFIEVTTDAGTRHITGACQDAGPQVPVYGQSVCVEDCGCDWVWACDGATQLRFGSACGFCAAGQTCSMSATYDYGDAGTFSGNAMLRHSSLPVDGGVVGGDFTGTVLQHVPDSGPVSLDISGRFCVLWPR